MTWNSFIIDSSSPTSHQFIALFPCPAQLSVACSTFPGPTQLSVTCSTFPCPAQLSVACSTFPGPAQLSVTCSTFPGLTQLSVACSTFPGSAQLSVTCMTESWAGPGNEANQFMHLFSKRLHCTGCVTGHMLLDIATTIMWV